MDLRRLCLTLLLAGCGASGTGADPAGPIDPPVAPPIPPSSPPPAGTVASVGGCQLFPAGNAWNRDVSADPAAADAAALLSVMSPSGALHLDLGTSEEFYGIPFTVVPANQPLVTIEFGTDGADYSDESDPGPMPIPHDAPIEGGSSAAPDPGAGDRHVLVVRQGDCILYELYNAVRSASGFRVSSAARWDLKVNATRPAGWTSADAAGLPILPGLLKYDEVAAGRITHALRFTIPRVRRAYVAPASHCGQYADATLPPYGTRVRLRADFPLGAYTGDALVILTALKTYGLMLADQGSAWYVTGTSDPRWESALDQLRSYPVHGGDFEVLASGAMTTC
jgi:hypothetical protein